MGKKNDLLNQYLEKTEIFAEFCNAVIYDGQREILARDLADAQRNYARMRRGRDGVLRSRVRERDVIKLLCRTPHFVKIAVENQDSLHFCMPLRCREYDDMELVAQFSGMKRRHRAAKDLREEHFRTGLRDLIALLKRREDKEAMGRYLADNQERLDHLDEELYDLLCAMLNLNGLRKQKEKYYNEETEDYRMCTAFREMLADSKMEGRKEGKREGIEIGEKRGREKGEKHGERCGREQGEKRLGLLIERLIKDGRQEDALRASRYAAARKRLYLEYGL